jgi:xanthine dehydrogenase accessory factor
MHSLRVLVVGSGDVASAVAHSLFAGGHQVVIQEEPSPTTLRRGMSFTDAIFAGKSELAGLLAKCCHDQEAVGAMQRCGKALPLVVGELDSVARVFQPHVLVDGRMRKRAIPPILRGGGAKTVGIGPGFECGQHVDLVIESQWGPQLGHLLTHGRAAALAGEPTPIGGVGRERFVYSPREGTFRTSLDIGARVEAGQIVAHVDDSPVSAPMAGVLRGIVHDEVRVQEGTKLIEVDPRHESQCFGLGERPRAIAAGVLRAIEQIATI